MLHFNELCITEDRKHLVVDVELDSGPASDKCYLDEVFVDAGSSCKTSLFSDPVLVWHKKIVGDYNDDGIIDAADYGLLNTLYGVCGGRSGLSGVTYTSADPIYTRDGKYYYKYRNPQYDEDDPASGDEWFEQEVSYEIVELCSEIIKNYRDVILGQLMDHFTEGVFLNWLTSDFNEDVYRKIVYWFTRRNNPDVVYEDIILSGVPGDINNDGEANVGDINALMEFVYSYASGDLEESDYIVIKDSHQRLCISVEDLAPLGILPSDSLDGLYFVRATAGCDTETLVNTSCGCDPSTITGVAYDGQPLYDAAVKYAAAYGNTCETNDMTAFMDWLLRYYGFLFALKNGDLCRAQYYWSQYLSGTASSTFRPSNSCGCNGTR